MIIVTGASRGLGRAICERLMSKGKRVVGLARNAKNLPFESFSCDVGDSNQVGEVYKILKNDGEPVDALINAAGIASMNLAVLTPSKITQAIIQTNLLGTLFCCQTLSPLMMRAKRGAIINFSTIAVELGLKGESIYIASKAGVEGFSRAFAREMADFDIRVNCISPGPMDTDLIKNVHPAKIDKIIAQQIINRQFNPEAVCDIVELLLDVRSNSITGEVFHIGGV